MYVISRIWEALCAMRKQAILEISFLFVHGNSSLLIVLLSFMMPSFALALRLRCAHQWYHVLML